MTEAEVARDLHGVLTRVQQGVEVVIERNDRPIAVIKRSTPSGRNISEIVADLRERGSMAVIDDEFAHDIEETIKLYREPWPPPSWE